MEKVTWELASSIPKPLIDEFEAGVSSGQESTVTTTAYGVVSHTLITSSKQLQVEEPSPKHIKQSSLWEEGYGMHISN